MRKARVPLWTHPVPVPSAFFCPEPPLPCIGISPARSSEPGKKRCQRRTEAFTVPERVRPQSFAVLAILWVRGWLGMRGAQTSRGGPVARAWVCSLRSAEPCLLPGWATREALASAPS